MRYLRTAIGFIGVLLFVQKHKHALMNRAYPELKTRIARLETEAERVRQFELPAVIVKLNPLIEHYELTEAMIFDASRKKSLGKPRTVLMHRYLDQATGNTWTGRGRNLLG